MTALNWMRAASAVTTLTVAALGAILVPAAAWNPPAVAAAGLMALLCASTFWLPATMRGARGGDAAVLAAIGPSGVLYGGLLMLAGAALVLGLLGWDRAAWAANVLVVAGFLIGTAVTNAASQVVDAAAARTAAPSASALWQARLQAMAAVAQDDNRAALERVAEQIRFSPSAGGMATPEDEGIAQALGELEAGALPAESMAARLKDLEARIARRAVGLQAARSHA